MDNAIAVAISSEQDEAFTSAGLGILSDVRSLIITDQASYDVHASYVRRLTDLIKTVRQTFDPFCASAQKAHKDAVSARGKHIDGLIETKRLLTAKCAKFESDQAAILQARRNAASLEAKREAESMTLDNAIHAEGMGEHPDLVNAILDDPPQALATPVAADFVRAKGITRKSPPRALVYDLARLISWIGSHPDHTHLLSANQSALNALARSGALKYLKIDGVKLDER